MTEEKFELGQQVVIKTCHSGIRGHEGKRGEIVADWHDGDFTIRREDGGLCVASKIELIEAAEPRRYAGELREGMRVMVKEEVDNFSLWNGEDKMGVVCNGGKHDGWWIEFPNGEWSDIDDYRRAEIGGGFYISHVISEPEEKKPAEATPFSDGVRQLEEWMKYGMSNFCLGNEEDASPYLMHMGADGFAVPVPIMNHCNCKISFKNSPHKGGIQKFMEGLKSIPAKIKRILNPNYKAFYQLEWVDEELDLTAKGRIELLDMLLDKHEAELGELAKKEVARRKKHSVQDEE